ncbi:MAG: hypothetical protein PW788_07185 [Micavibrio sp.]|nr:hypothetical protein [Micavibrio sp.]
MKSARLLFSALMLTAAVAKPAAAEIYAPYEYKVLAPVGRGLPVCDHVYGALLNMRNDHYLTFGPGDAGDKPNRGEHSGAPDFSVDANIVLPTWQRLEWTDFRTAKPQMYHDLTAAGQLYGTHYSVSKTRVDIEGSGHREEIYRIGYNSNAQFNQLILDKDDENTAIAPYFYALQPSYTFIYDGKPYFMKRAKGSAEVYQFWTDRAHNPPGGNISTTMLCRFTANVTAEGTSTQEMTTTVPQAGTVYQDGTKK